MVSIWEIPSIDASKILLSSVITKEINAYLLGPSVIPYSGLVITIKENTGYNYNDVLRILRSNEFIEYIKKIGLKSSSSSYRISANDIKQYRFSGGNL